MPKDLLKAQLLDSILHGMHAGILHDAGFLPHRTPPKRERQSESAVKRDRIVVDAGGREIGKDGYQVRRRLQGRLPLHVSEIRSPLHSHLAVRPRLLGRPLDRIVTVFLLVSERIPFAFRFVPSAHILENEHIAPARKEYGRGIGVWKSFRAVWRARHQHWILSLTYRT